MRTIAHISDLHFGRHDPVLADALLDSISENSADLVVVSGDLTQRGRRKEFAAARAFLDRIGAPTIAVPGNHDVPLYNLARRFLSPLERFDHYVSREGAPVFIDKEIAVLGINTARSFALKNGRISFDQMRGIEAMFTRLPRHLCKILVTHHPLLTPTGEQMLDPVGRARSALEVIAGAGVDLLLSGHFHRAFHGDMPLPYVAADRSVLVIQAGTAISTRIRDTKEAANTYNLIRIGSELLSITIHGWSGTRFAAIRTETYRLVAGSSWRAAHEAVPGS